MSKLSGISGKGYYIKPENEGKLSFKGKDLSPKENREIEPIVISEAAIILMEMALRSQVLEQ